MNRSLALVAILLLAALLRFPFLGELPRGFHPDEASEAFEAWTVARTGHSSDGHRLTFPNHGIGRIEGTYTWLAAAPVGLLELTGVERAARLPAAIAGLLAVLGTFRLARQLLGERAALIAALLVASEPIAVHFSRCALRATLEPALLSWGLALALEGLDEKRGRWRALLGGALLGVAILTYPPARVVVPVVAIVLAATVKSTRERTAALLVPVLAALVAITPFALTPEGSMRLREISVLNAPGAHDGPGHGVVLDALRGYVLHFAPRTLIAGDFERGFWATGVPALLWVEVPLLIVGLVTLARRRSGKAVLVLSLLLAAPLASAFTRPAPNLIRAIFLVPALALVAAAGFDALVGGRRRPVLIAFAVLWVASLAFAVHRYTTVFPREQSSWLKWQGYRDGLKPGDLLLHSDLERALVDLYARDRRRVWAEGGRSRTRVRID